MDNEDIKIVDRNDSKRPFEVASCFGDSFTLTEDHIAALKSGKRIALNIMDEYIVYLSYKANQSEIP